MILLNGASSSGKSSIAQLLQLMLPMPILNAGLDQFFGMLPAGFIDFDHAPEDEMRRRFTWLAASDGIAAAASAQADKWRADMRRTIASMAGLGNHLVVDEIITRSEWVADYRALLAAQEVLWVGVRCPLAVLEARERERVGRVAGQAREHFDLVHAHCRYDIEVDSGDLSPYQCAKLIVDYLDRRAGA